MKGQIHTLVGWDALRPGPWSLYSAKYRTDSMLKPFIQAAFDSLCPWPRCCLCAGVTQLECWASFWMFAFTRGSIALCQMEHTCTLRRRSFLECNHWPSCGRPSSSHSQPLWFHFGMDADLPLSLHRFFFCVCYWSDVGRKCVLLPWK